MLLAGAMRNFARAPAGIYYIDYCKEIILNIFLFGREICLYAAFATQKLFMASLKDKMASENRKRDYFCQHLIFS